MNNKTEKQLKDMENAMKSPSESAVPNGELPDDALDGVAGGAVLNSLFYIARCKKCGWQSCPFDNRGVLYKRHSGREGLEKGRV